MTNRPLILALGNPDRGDDGLGPAVAEVLRAGSLYSDLATIRGEATEILSAIDKRQAALVIDCLAADPRGDVLKWDLHDETALQQLAGGSSSSTHGSGLIEALRLGQVLDALPSHFRLIGVTGGRFDVGAPLSDAVKAAIPRVAQEAHAWDQFHHRGDT